MAFIGDFDKASAANNRERLPSLNLSTVSHTSQRNVV